MTLYRDQISFAGLQYDGLVTFYASEALDKTMIASGDENNVKTYKPGVAVTMVANQYVGKGSEDDPLVGMLRTFDETPRGKEIAGVQERGYAKFLYTGTNPSYNDSVVVDGAGNVKLAGSTNRTLVVDVNTTKKWVTIIIR